MKTITALLALSLSACAVFDVPQYDWFESGKPKLERVVWEQKSPEHIQKSCGFSDLSRSLFAGCMVRLNNSGAPYCLVQSTLSEAEARKVYDATGMSHYEHETEFHCRKGLNHGVRK